MNPFVPFAIAAAIATMLVARSVARLARRRDESTAKSATGCWACLAIVVPLTVAYLVLLPKLATSTGTGVTAVEANAQLVTIRVPLSATNVDFRYAYFSGTIDEAHFDLSLEDFRQWMAQNGWDVHEFFTDETGFQWKDWQAPQGTVSYQQVYSISTSNWIEVANGFRYDQYSEDSPDSGLSVIYDIEKQRVYMWQSTY